MCRVATSCPTQGIPLPHARNVADAGIKCRQSSQRVMPLQSTVNGYLTMPLIGLELFRPSLTAFLSTQTGMYAAGMDSS